MTKEIDELMKQNVTTLEEVEQWAARLHSFGKECRLGVGGRLQKQIPKYGRTYVIIEVNEKQRRDYRSDEYPDGIPLPCFMGHEGFALREIR